MRLLMLLLLAVILAGCAEPFRWTKDGFVQTDFQREEFECMQAARTSNPSAVWPASQAQYLTVPARAIYIKCMETKGYRRAE
jgi:hypothetical protein